MSSIPSHYYPLNHGGYVDIGGSRSKYTRKCSSFNQGTRVHVEGTGGYRSPTSHCYPPNQGERGILLNFSGYTVVNDGRVGYRSQTSHYYSRRGDIRGESARQVSRTEDINQSYLFNVGETVGGVGRIGSRSQTIPSPSHHSVGHGRSSDFYSYCDNRSGHRSQTSQFYAYNHGGIKSAHPRFPQEYFPRGLNGEKMHQNNTYYYYPSMPTKPHQNNPPISHQNMPPHIYPIIPPHQVCVCTYCTSTPKYAPYVVSK